LRFPPVLALLLLPPGGCAGVAGVGGVFFCAGAVDARLRGVLLLLLPPPLLAEVASAADDDGAGLGVFRLEVPFFLGVSASEDCVYVGGEGRVG
jgi:hypothetical protein